MGVLGVAEEYTASIIDGKTEEPLVYLPWSKIQWQRAKNRLSLASAFIADNDGGVESCGSIGGLRSWNQMLRIERNGTTVWDGPITSWGRGAILNPGVVRGFTIRAHDRLAIAQRRLIRVDLHATTGSYPVSMNQVPLKLMTDANLGVAGTLPYNFTLPSLSDFMTWGIYIDNYTGPLANIYPDSPNSNYTVKIEREYRAARLEYVLDALTELASRGILTFTQVGSKMWASQMALQNLLGGVGTRPSLNEATTVGIPSVEVDAFGQATVVYMASTSAGKAGFMQIAAVAPSTYTTVVGQLDLGISSEAPSWSLPYQQYVDGYTPVDAAGQLEATESATPTVTIEQIELSPKFGSPSLKDDLSNLVPGVIFDIGYTETCAFNVPVSGVSAEFRRYPKYDLSGSQLAYAQVATPTYSTAVRAARLEQLDVEVSIGDGGERNESVKASLVPFADWDGTLPSWWREPDMGY